MMQTLKEYWLRASAREQVAMRIAATLVLLALFWWVGLQPPLKALKNARTQAPVVRAQYEQMLQLQAQAAAMRTQVQQPVSDPKAALQESISTIEKNARVALAGERATVSFKQARPADLALWLEQVRLKAHSSVLEMHISQAAGLWSGSVVVQLPSGAQP
jgi:general secretion pathway protein M